MDMKKAERYFLDNERSMVITESKLQAEFNELKATHDTDCETFEQYVEACCSKNGSPEQLHRGPGNFNTDGGNDVDAANRFYMLLEAMCAEQSGRDVKIVIDGFILEAYDHAALMQGLLDAMDALINQMIDLSTVEAEFLKELDELDEDTLNRMLNNLCEW